MRSLLVLLLATSIGFWAWSMPRNCNKAIDTIPGRLRPPRSPDTSVVCTSEYVRMPDGVRLAVDVCKPSDIGPTEQLPVVVRFTRYWRSFQIKVQVGDWVLFGPFRHHLTYNDVRPAVVTRGYVWLDVDVRGTGASFGHRVSELGPEEMSDSHHVIQWAAQQAWSDGNVGVIGVSYEGIAAEFAVTTQPPALKAAVLMFSPWDIYEEYLFPGGVRNMWLLDVWGGINKLLDNNDLSTMTPPFVHLNVHPVESDDLVAAAVKEHQQNWDLVSVASNFRYRDDVVSGLKADDLSPHRRFGNLVGSGVPIMLYSGWLDGANCHAALKRFATLSADPRHRLVLGGWQHTGTHGQVSGGGTACRTCSRHELEIVPFLDAHLKHIQPPASDAIVKYFTVGRGWSRADSFPPTTTRLALHLASRNGLQVANFGSGLVTRIQATRQLDSGPFTRWHALVHADFPVAMPNLVTEFQHDSHTHFTSAAFPQATQITGMGEVHLVMRFDCPQSAVHAYLYDVDAGGVGTYITEGLLHASFASRMYPVSDVNNRTVPARNFHRSSMLSIDPTQYYFLSFHLLPTSYLIPAGHRVRLAVRLAESGLFESGCNSTTTRSGADIASSSDNPTSLYLPVVGALPQLP